MRRRLTAILRIEQLTDILDGAEGDAAEAVELEDDLLPVRRLGQVDVRLLPHAHLLTHLGFVFGVCVCFGWGWGWVLGWGGGEGGSDRDERARGADCVCVWDSRE